MNYSNEIYLGTVCLEKNRWGSRIPSIKISDYLETIQQAGFDGIELWENHMLKVDSDEQERLKQSNVPIKIFNTYALGDEGYEQDREAALTAIQQLKPNGIKFNFGKDINEVNQCVKTMDNWLNNMPKNMRLLCEYHSGFSVSVDNLFQAEEYTKSMQTNIEAISHAFSDKEQLYRQLVHMRDQITHVHVAYLRKKENNIPEILKLLRKTGFKGSFTIEFTFGVAEYNEDVNYVLENAIRDLQTLRYYLDNE